MSQTQEDESGQSPVKRAEELVDQIGQRVGLLAALASQRIQTAAMSLREGASQTKQPQETQQSPSEQATKEPTRSAMEKAEELVDRTGERLGQFAGATGLQIRRAVALARENLEDMWVDAQEIRHRNRRESQ